MKEEKILTLHPQGKKGVNIAKSKYDTISEFIISTTSKRKDITYKEVNDLAIKKLSKNFDGSVPWYLVSVKLDLEARGIIERIPKTSPHKLRLAKK